MKRLYVPLVALLMLSFTTGICQVVNIPDPNFKHALIYNDGLNTNRDQEIQTSEAIAFRGTIEADGRSINSLAGIESFPNITRLYVSSNNLTSVDVSANTKLVALRVDHNRLTTIDLSSNPLLTELKVHVNQLTSLDLSANTGITWLMCFQNQFAALDLSPLSALTKLECGQNPFTHLDVSSNHQLTYFACTNSSLRSLNMKNGNNTAIEFFDIRFNEYLFCVDVDDPAYSQANWTEKDRRTFYSTDCASALAEIVNIPDPRFKRYLVEDTDLNANQDSEIQVAEARSYVGFFFLRGYGISDLTGVEAFPELWTLDVSSNNLTTIDVSHNTKLRVLRVDINPISSIDVSMLTELEEFHCFKNPMVTTLDLSHNTKLTSLRAFDNSLASLDLSHNTRLASAEIQHNKIVTLTLGANTSLTTLQARDNRITSVDLSGCINLQWLEVNMNQLTAIDLSRNTKLVSVNVGDNQITKLNFRNNLALSGLSAYTNKLDSLDLRYNYNLRTVVVFINPLKYLNLQNGANVRMTLNAEKNKNLFCIQVDDAAWSQANWTKVDPHVTFSEDCNPNDADIVFIPDANFKSRVVGNPAINTNGDSEIQRSEATGFTGTLDLSGAGIVNPKGIEAFTAIPTLNFGNNNLTFLFIPRNAALKRLDADSNKLALLWINTGLKELRVRSNSLQVSFNPSFGFVAGNNNTLEILDIRSNIIGGISHDYYAFIPSLRELYASGNSMYVLDLSRGTNIEKVILENTMVQRLDFHLNTKLNELVATGNSNLVSLNIQNGNNTNMTVNATNNPLLECIQVDNKTYADSHFEIDEEIAYFSTNCATDAGPIVNIPDPNFKSLLVSMTTLNTNGDSEIQRSEAHKFAGVIAADNRNISSTTGLASFWNLVRLNISGNNLTTIDISQNKKMRELTANNNQLSSISLPESEFFSQLSLSNNRFTSIDLSGPFYLSSINMSGNQLTNIDFGPQPHMRSFNLANNRLTSLTLPANTSVFFVDVSGNDISSIDFSQQINLQTINISGNPIASIDVSKSKMLYEIRANSTELTTLDFAAQKDLRILEVADTRITALDFTRHEIISRIVASNGMLRTLDVRSGYNTRITGENFQVAGNPDLTCIEVDNVDYSEANWRSPESTDPSMHFSTNCAEEGNDDAAMRMSEPTVSVWPNPTTDRIQIDSTTPVEEVRVYDAVSGDLVDVQQGTDIDMTARRPGIYVIKVLSGERITARRIVKQ